MNECEENKGLIRCVMQKVKKLLREFGVPEAPIDGIQYGRQDGEWTEITGGSGGVQSVTGDLVDNTDSNNPIINTPNLQQVGDVDEFVWIDAGGNNIASVGSALGGLDAVSFAATDDTALVQKSGSILASSTGFRTESTIDDTSKIAIAGQAVIGKALNFKVDNTLPSGDYTLAVKESTFITKTKAEIDDIITAGLLDPNDGLIPGTMYEITNVHPSLYTGNITVRGRVNKIEYATGSGYVDGVYLNVPVDGGSGTGLFADVVVSGGIVDDIDVSSNTLSMNYLVGDILTINNIHLGGSGAGFEGTLTFSNISDISNGTTIYLKALTPTTLEKNGHGLFWTPKYQAINGYNIWDLGMTTPTVGDKTIWGGYSWTNVNGLVGLAIDVLTLNSEWSKDIYSLTDYNKVINPIKYDYDNDWVYFRSNTEGIEVEYTKADQLRTIDNISLEFSSISTIQWGNVVFDFFGSLNNKIQNSYVEDVNFMGEINSGNLYNIACLIYNNFYPVTSRLENSVYINTTLANSILVGNSSIRSCTFESNSYIDGITILSTMLFNLEFPKTIYKRPDGTNKIRYYNDSNVLVIADITD